MPKKLLLWLAPLLGPAVALAQLPGPMTARDSALHALNRLAFGPRPGEIDSVARVGVNRWIESQLSASESDPALKAAEVQFDLLKLSPDELAARAVEVMKERRKEKQQGEDRLDIRRDRKRNGEDPRRLAGQFQQLVVTRAVLAQNQLQEVMADFWTNHFNVVLTKGADRYLLPGYIERTIRPHAMGRFADLLLAVARSPAMLFYLDNVRSVAPGSEPPALRNARFRRFMGPRADSLQARLPTGINENYARELLELHTLGVDGGYTQQDVINTARILTGWSMERPDRGAGFEFHDWAHDYGEKVVLGVRFPAGHGQDEGEKLLRMLAEHPATMHHVSAKLCQRFVSDEPTDGCIDDAVAAWKVSHGDIREVLRAIFHSPDFWSPGSVGHKFKTPLEFVASATRAVGARPDTSPVLAGTVARLGQPLYLQASPAGYPAVEAEWANSGALLERMNVASALAAGRLGTVAPDIDQLVSGALAPNSIVHALGNQLFAGRISAHTAEVISREAADPPGGVDPRVYAVALALGAPEFQRR
ncbi:MAG TPA: DUF1800 domain-containing protein [Gemmatimonadales bacterium]|nr:DUF1800 domain-containing protein [Gemmatimonadales bacterium]